MHIKLCLQIQKYEVVPKYVIALQGEDPVKVEVTRRVIKNQLSWIH